MSQPALQFRALFLWLMGFTALVWIWTVALILAWPWNKDGQWAADLPLVATCAEGKACASKARLCASCASLMVRSPLGSMEKSNHANAPGPMRNGARRLSTWNASGICGARPYRSCSLLPTPCISTSSQGWRTAGFAGRCWKVNGKSSMVEAPGKAAAARHVKRQRQA